jgi:signal transduction histidine kinase
VNSAYAYTPAIWPPLLGAMLLAAMSLYAWRRRDVPAGKPFVAVSLLGSLILLGMALQAAAVAPETRIAWYKFEFVTQMFTASAGTCFSLDYVYPGRWLTCRNLVLLFLPPFLLLLLVVIDDSRLVWRSLQIQPGGSVQASFAFAGGILLVYTWSLVFVNTAAFLWLFIRSPHYRWPAAIMLCGQWAGRVAYLFFLADRRLLPLVDPYVLAFGLTWTAYAIALFGFRIFDPLHAARQTVLEQMHAGVAVFDAAWRVVRLYPAAEKMLGISESAARGKTWQQMAPPGECLPARPADRGQPAGTELECSEMTLGSGAAARHYALAFSELRDFRGLLIGHLLMLRDVTDQRRAQRQILEQQRAAAMLQERGRLARELHDELGQVLAYVAVQARAARDLVDRDQGAAAHDYLTQLIAVAQETHTDVREFIAGAQLTADPAFHLLAALEQYLHRFGANHGLRAELVVAPGFPAGALDLVVQIQLLRIVQEALTNARKHGLARCVQVRFERADGRARVTVHDDGTGFAPPDFGAAGAGRGADAGDAAHFGLRFMRERAQEMGGTFTIVSAPGQGTQVIVDAPFRE